MSFQTDSQSAFDPINDLSIIMHGKKKYKLFSSPSNSDSSGTPNHANLDAPTNETNPPENSNVEPEIVIEPNAVPNETVETKKVRKRKLEIVALQADNRAFHQFDSEPNLLQRGKYGLRLLPPQVDYYQSVLEERKAKISKTPTKITKDDTTDSKLNIPQRKSPRFDEKLKVHDIPEEPVAYGDIVWATLPAYRVWFPALYVSHLHCGQKFARSGHAWVYWFGDHQVSEIPKSKIKPFFPYFEQFSKGTSSIDGPRMREALQVLAYRAGLNFPLDYQNQEDALKKWALDGFPLPTDKEEKSKLIASDHLNPIPPIVACHLPLDAIQQEALKTDDRLQQLVFYEVQSADSKEDNEPLVIPEFKQSQITRIKNGELTVNDICIACCCDHNSAADVINGEKILHPLFEGFLCKQCKETIKCTMYAPGIDNKNSFCAICGQVGKLAVCENLKCHKVFCFVCLNLYVSSEVETEIMAADSWSCFICKNNSLPSNCLLKPRSEWRDLVRTMFDPLRCHSGQTILHNDLRPLRVLSLYDGISSNYVALKNLNLTISEYHAVESDKDALSVIKHNYKDAIHIIENIDALTPFRLASMIPIDLVIGGPPCVEVNSSNSNKKGVFDLKSGGSHFLHFHHILNLIRLFNKGHHVFFLFDSNTSMSISNRDIISNFLMCKPVTLNAKGMCSPARSRYFWSNIPGINRPLSEEATDNYIKLSNNIAINNLKKTNANDKYENEMNSGDDPVGLEKMLGLSENYTDTGTLSKAKRLALLSKAWSANITSHVLWALVDFFQSDS